MRPCVPGLVFVARFLIASSVSFPVIGLFSFSIFSVFRHYRLCASMSLCVSYRLTRFWCMLFMNIHAQSCPTVCNPMGCSLPGSSVRGIFQARIPGVGYHFLLQGIFPTWGSNPSLLCLLHCRQGIFTI